jgi:hypothetical protein
VSIPGPAAAAAVTDTLRFWVVLAGHDLLGSKKSLGGAGAMMASSCNYRQLLQFTTINTKIKFNT